MLTDGLRVVPLIEAPLWTRFFSVAPLVLVGTKEGDHFDIAPKHMAMPLGWKDFYCFCLQRPARDLPKRRRARRLHGELLGEELIAQTGLAASARLSDASKPGPAVLSTFPRWLSTASCRAADCISSASSSVSWTASEPASWSAGPLRPPRARTCFVTQRRTTPISVDGGRPAYLHPPLRDVRDSRRSCSPPTFPVTWASARQRRSSPGSTSVGAMTALLRELVMAESPSLEPEGAASSTSDILTLSRGSRAAVYVILAEHYGDHLYARARARYKGAGISS